METALEENRRMNTDRADAMLLRAYNMYRHPLLLSIQEEGLAAQSVPVDGAAIDALAIPAAFKGVNCLLFLIQYVIFACKLNCLCALHACFSSHCTVWV